MTNYAPILNKTENQTTVFLCPDEALRFVLRMRRVSFFIRTGVDLVTEFEPTSGRPVRAYEDMGGNIPVSARVAMDMLKNLKRFNDQCIELSKKTGKVSFCRLGDCIFIG